MFGRLRCGENDLFSISISALAQVLPQVPAGASCRPGECCVVGAGVYPYTDSVVNLHRRLPYAPGITT